MTWERVALCIVSIALLGALARDTAPRVDVPPVIVTEPAQALQARYDALTIEADGLRARLAGRSEVIPDTVYQTDTLVAAPDTVLAPRMRFDLSSGRLTFGTLTRAADGLYAPTVRVVTVGDCDDGLAIDGTRVTCDAARLGHLWVGLGARVTRDWGALAPRPGVDIVALWKPSYRSPWSVELSVGVVVELRVSRLWSIF